MSDFRPLAALLPRLKELAAQMKGQDNAATAHPIFVVQQRHRIHGIDPNYSDLFEWIDVEGRAADAEEHERLEAAFQQDEDDDEGERQFWTRAHYVDSWENVQPFFSRSGAEGYMARNRHNLTDPRIYVDSAHRNAEWQLVRELLVELAKAEQ